MHADSLPGSFFQILPMLKLCDSSDFWRLEHFCSVSDPFAAYIFCRAECYGFSQPFCETWLSICEKEVKAVLSVFCQNAVLFASDSADFEELSVFFKSGSCKTLLTDSVTAVKLGFQDINKKKALIFDGKRPDNTCIDKADYKQVYSLLCECFPEEYCNEKEQYLTWLSDITFRQNRHFARVKTVIEDGQLCACALTVAETEKAAVIGGVCCAESKRGRGFAGRTVLSAVSELGKEGKDVFVFARRDVAEGFYKKLGFSFYKDAAYIERN